jgi:hypothetical protein
MTTTLHTADVSEAVDPEHIYTEIARRFFNEFLEFKLQIGDYVSPEKHDKALAQYKKANRDLRAAAGDLSKENERLSALVEEQESTIIELRRQLNEAVIKGQLGQRIAKAAKDHHNVPFDQLMSEETFRNWQQFMSEVPRGTNGR